MIRLGILPLASLVWFLTTVACNNNHKSTAMNATNNINAASIFPLGQRGSSDWFTGDVNVQGLVNPDEVEGIYSISQVTFQPGGRTSWHTHPIGQVLLVTEGSGWYQERGKLAQELTKGTVVAIPKDVEHWHGAASDSRLVHTAISNIQDNSLVTWLSPVTDEEYDSLK